MTEVLSTDESLEYVPEIERRFLVCLGDVTPDILTTATQVLYICQGYATDTIGKFRIRSLQDASTGRCEYHFARKKGKALDKSEGKRPISEEEFAAYWPSTDGWRIEKCRYLIPHGDFVIELDFFNTAEGYATDFVVAEIEFDSHEEAEGFADIPSWFGPEITHVAGMTNSRLARYGFPPSIADADFSGVLSLREQQSGV
jgi:CYTH domain-containing protein